MSYNQPAGNINKEILINQLGLRQDRNTVFFENDEMIVLSPSIQNDSWWFDLLIGNVEKVLNSEKEGLLILRLFNDLLIADLKSFLNKMVTEETVVKREKGKDNWKFNIKIIENNYIVINQKNTELEYQVDKVDVTELLRKAEKYSNKQLSMDQLVQYYERNFFSIKTADPESVKAIRTLDNPIEITRLNWYENELRINDIVFLVLGGDKAKPSVTWDNGLIAIGKVIRGPYEQGYEKNNFKIKVQVELILPKQLKQSDFIPYLEIYDLPGITPSTKGAPNQAIFNIKISQAEILVRALLDKFPDKYRDLIAIFGEDFIKRSCREITYLKEKKEVYNKRIQHSLDVVSIEEFLNHIHSYLKSYGFLYSEENIVNLYLSLRTKPFVIISGISGTGKTKIVQLFAEAIDATEKNGQFKLIPVRPDWSDSSDLLGYRDIKGEFVKGPLTEMVEHALDHPELPHFVLLDEMNLARVEYYFSDVLSVMESRKKDEEGNYTSSPLLPSYDESLTLPGNLYVIGTVNMDETTHSFSKKVLDRANTIEFNEIDLMNFDSMLESEPVESIRVSNDILESSYIHLIDAFSTHEQIIRKVSEKINSINELLKPIHAQVGYRVRDEISFYMAHNAEADMLLSENEALDFCIMQKILPRISGTESVVRPVLKGLEDELKEYPKCSAKIEEMLKRLDDNGFVSFWTA